MAQPFLEGTGAPGELPGVLSLATPKRYPHTIWGMCHRRCLHAREGKSCALSIFEIAAFEFTLGGTFPQKSFRGPEKLLGRR